MRTCGCDGGWWSDGFVGHVSLVEIATRFNIWRVQLPPHDGYVSIALARRFGELQFSFRPPTVLDDHMDYIEDSLRINTLFFYEKQIQQFAN